MSIPPKKERSDYRAGLCVTVVLLVIMAAIFTSMELQTETPRGQEFVISVPLDTGVDGIDSSSKLIYGGLTVGSVKTVTFDKDQMLITIAMSVPLNLHKSVRIIKQGSLLGGTTNLVVVDTGNSEPAEKIASGDVIKISKSPSGVAGIVGTEGSEAIDRITENIEKSAIGFRGIVQSVRSNSDISSIRNNYEALSGSIRTDLPEWEKQFGLISEQVERIRAKGDRWTRELTGLKTTATRFDDSMKELTTHFGETELNKLEDSINTMRESFEATRVQFESEVIPLADDMIDLARASWDDLSQVIERLKALAREGKRSIDYALAQTTLAAQQLNLTIDEVIGGLGIPLLERPSEPQIQLMIRNAAFSEWARSATQMREILDAISQTPFDRNDPIELEEATTMARLVDLLRASLADYEQAQKEFEEIRIFGSQGSLRRNGVDDQDQ